MTVTPFSNYKKIVLEPKVRKTFPLMWGYALHRHLSAVFSYMLLFLFPSLRPNAVSIGMILIGMSGCALIALADSIELFVVGIALVYLSFLLDKVDGEIARFTNRHSLTGLYLDELYHSLVPSALAAAFVYLVVGTTSDALVSLVFVWLVLAVRHNRKSPQLIHVKSLGKSRFPVPERAALSAVARIDRVLPTRLAAVVERFDIMLFIYLCGGVLFFVKGGEWGIAVIYMLLTFYGLQYLRWVLRLSTGDTDMEVVRLRKEGY